MHALSPRSTRTTVVFDLGGVLIDWNPRHLYRKLFVGDDAGMERFLSEVCTNEWNLQQDAGRTFAEGAALLKAEHPEQADLIDAFHKRWPETIGGAIDGTVAILRELKEANTPLYALTNWSHETFVHASQFAFMSWFGGVVVSGEEKLIKPDPAIYHLLMDRYGLVAETMVYIDDNTRNAQAATDLGMHGIHFTSPDALRRELTALGLLHDMPAEA
ncbi:HAD family phosphatase [Bradyrhizobium prioriisuperbiae]|uniref:HAD family hydrolase n=1 Tax=Bradyrhizobium prioriisuperbiae TaxID=2854389 RepID=UPI0028E49CDA|nr:HAD family phosphatase [Bradyrhizobium prioritasuperba]